MKPSEQIESQLRIEALRRYKNGEGSMYVTERDLIMGILEWLDKNFENNSDKK